MKFLKYTFIIFIILGLAGSIAYWIVDKPLPNGIEGKEAEKLTDKMLMAVNEQAWDSTAIVEWNYNDMHNFVWDKNRNLAKVSWEHYDIFIDLHKKSGIAYAKGKRVKDSTATAEFIKKAYAYWVNDSFWLNPITKLRDQGTSRELVEIKNENETALLVTYSSGGLTPGDSYLWIVDKDTYRPKAVQMWVSIIPIGGIEFSWEEYVRTETGAVISTFHAGLMDIHIYDLKTYKSISIYEEGDIFNVLVGN